MATKLSKIKIGITGQNGFVGKHLYNYLRLFPDEFQLFNFEKHFFSDDQSLNAFVSKCDVIVHLAGVNRDKNPESLFQKNIDLTEKLINAFDFTNSTPSLIFSSSSQEDLDNLYGRSKKESRKMFAKWAARTGSMFTGLIIPNVFGPFGRPYYNSFIATFCYQLTHNEQPKIEVDGCVKLIYIDDLIKKIVYEITSREPNPELFIPATSEYKVSEILNILESFKSQYFIDGIIPEFRNQFEVNLFNTYRSFIDMRSHYPVKFVKHSDQRGAFVEVVRMRSGGQVSFSTTFPGITRGNHYHTRKIERFAVIQGKARIQLRQIGTEEILNYYLDGEEPAYVDMPVWYTHNITNIGNDELLTNFWINEFYDPQDPDTYFETV